MPPDRPPGSSVSIRRLRDVLLYVTLLVPFAAALQQPPHDAYSSQPAVLDAAATTQRAYNHAADSLSTKLSAQRGVTTSAPLRLCLRPSPIRPFEHLLPTGRRHPVSALPRDNRRDLCRTGKSRTSYSWRRLTEASTRETGRLLRTDGR
jgi:hypothetical protein